VLNSKHCEDSTERLRIEMKIKIEIERRKRGRSTKPRMRVNWRLWLRIARKEVADDDTDANNYKPSLPKKRT
jgi:hypothetical protein